MDDRDLVQIMVETLRPLAGVYDSLSAGLQLAYDDKVPVRVSCLRDAFLAVARYERAKRSSRQPAG